MKKTWLTAVSVAGVLGTGSAAVMASAVINASSTTPTAAPVPQSHGNGSDAPRTVVYAVGDAARVTLSSAGGVLTVISTEPGAAWSVVSTSSAGATVSVQLTDGVRLVAFTATANGDDVTASVSAAYATPTTGDTPASVPALVEQPGSQAPAAGPRPAASGGSTLSGTNNSPAPAPIPAIPPVQPTQASPHADEPTTTAARSTTPATTTPATTTPATTRPVTTTPATTQPAAPISPATTTAPSSAGTPHGGDEYESPEGADNGAESNDD